MCLLFTGHWWVNRNHLQCANVYVCLAWHSILKCLWDLWIPIHYEDRQRDWISFRLYYAVVLGMSCGHSCQCAPSLTCSVNGKVFLYKHILGLHNEVIYMVPLKLSKNKYGNENLRTCNTYGWCQCSWRHQITDHKAFLAEIESEFGDNVHCSEFR